MKYVITGGAGNISKPLAETLLKAGNDVTVVGRSAENLQPLTAQGAKAAIGSVEDEAFVTKAFAGAEAVYLMIPPNFGAADFRAYQNKVSDVYIKAVQENGISKIVLLSSIGAHMGNGAGPIDGLSDFEKKLALLPGIDVKILRPSYFISNLFGMIPMIKGAGIMGSNIGTDEKLILVHPTDIAAVAAEELLALNFTGQTIRYIASDERKPEEIASVLSNAIGKPGIPWIDFTDEQTNEGMLQAGLLQTMADAYTDMGKALREGKLQEDYRKHAPALGPTKLEDFAKEFAAAFNA